MVRALFERRSIRKYTDTPVKEKELETLLMAAMSAPSAGNQQTWEFIVLRNKNIMSEISKFHPHAKMLSQAQLAIVVCATPDRETRHPGCWTQDCSAATQNILIEAAHLKIGSVWIGVHPREDRVSFLRSLLNIPDNVIPFSIVSLGYPAEAKEPSKRFDRSRIHLEKW